MRRRSPRRANVCLCVRLTVFLQVEIYFIPSLLSLTGFRECSGKFQGKFRDGSENVKNVCDVWGS